MAVDVFKALASPSRRSILVELVERRDGLTLREICARLGTEHGLELSRQAVSQHLAALESAGLIRSRHRRQESDHPDTDAPDGHVPGRQEGARRLYTIEPAPLQKLDRWLDGFRRFWAPPLEALATELARGGRADQRADRSDLNPLMEAPMTEIANEDTSLTLVERSLRDREIGQGLARAAVLRRRYDAPVEDVWKAVTTPDRIDRFFLPVSGDLREGGSYAFEGQASGRILVCDAPRLLRVEWVPPGCRDDGDQVEVRLTPDGPDATWLELEHASVADVFHFDPDAETYSPALGWEGPLHYLGEFLRGALPDRPGVEWHEFDEAEEMRLAKFRAPEWAKAEAEYKSGR